MKSTRYILLFLCFLWILSFHTPTSAAPSTANNRQRRKTGKGSSSSSSSSSSTSASDASPSSSSSSATKGTKTKVSAASATASSLPSSSSSSPELLMQYFRAGYMGNSSRITEYTLMKNFNLNARTPDNKTILIVVLEGSQAHFDRLWPKHYNPQGHMETIQILLRAGVDPFIACPTLEAVTYRNMFALRHMFRWMNISSLIYCISANDSNGDNLLGAASKSTTAGISRIIFRATRLERNDTARMVLSRHLSLTIPSFTVTNEISKNQLERSAGTPEIDTLLDTLHNNVVQYQSENPIPSVPKDTFLSTFIGNYSLRNFSSILLPILHHRNYAGFTPFLISCIQGRANAIGKYLSLGSFLTDTEGNPSSMEFLIHQTIQPDHDHNEEEGEESKDPVSPSPPLAPAGASCIPIAVSRGYVDILKEIYKVFGQNVFLHQKIEYNIPNPTKNNLLLCDWGKTLGIVHQPVIEFLESIGACPTNETGISLWDDEDENVNDKKTNKAKPVLEEETIRNELLTQTFYPNVKRKGIEINHFELSKHTKSGWRALSPSQLAALRLPSALFETTSTSGASDSSSSPSPLCGYGYPVDSLPLDELRKDSKYIYQQYISHSRPFIIENAFNPTDLFVTKNKNNYVTKDSFVRYLDTLSTVLTGDVPYAQSYGSVGKDMNLRTFIDTYMGIGTSTNGTMDSVRTTGSTTSSVPKRKLSSSSSPTMTSNERSTRTNGKTKLVNIEHDGTQTEPSSVAVTVSNDDSTTLDDPSITSNTDTVNSTIDQPFYAIGPGSHLYFPPYIFDNQVIMKQSSLFQSYLSWLPSTLGKGRNASLANLKQFITGPAYSGAPPHYHLEAINTLFIGTKLWLLFPPASASFADDHVRTWYEQTYLTRFPRTDPKDTHRQSSSNKYTENTIDELRVPHYAFIQEPGDLVYIPPLWGHAILNLADTFAIAIE